ncbi:site-specific integrase [Vibrio sp. SS-MA-C1-2]|uniref:site-specific integrase n=1 Tax=Vibrio sp. SS-MA-C1-2 TaxID=2908646 RepID=UPI001F232302|nr:site-specific integrase [Vibrio sp. SS-MA-C1-2]UJF18102.1 site-specific integrase [Vibrio sp. SS-MA-C1-2]
MKTIAKKRSSVTIYITKQVIDVIEETKYLNRNNEFMFANHHHHSAGLPMNIRSANDILRDVGEKLKLDALGTHSMRHYYAESLIRSGANPVQVKDLLGQRSLNSTQVYLSTQDEELKALVELL